MCETHEEARRSWNTLNKKLANAEAALAEKNAALTKLNATIASLKGILK